MIYTLALLSIATIVLAILLFIINSKIQTIVKLLNSNEEDKKTLVYNQGILFKRITNLYGEIKKNKLETRSSKKYGR